MHPQTADTCQNPISKSCVSHCHWLNLNLRHMPETHYRGVIDKGVLNKPNNDKRCQVLTLSYIWKDLWVLTTSHTPIPKSRVGRWQRHTYGRSKPKTQESCQMLTLSYIWKDLRVLTTSQSPIPKSRVGQLQRHTYGSSNPKTQQSWQIWAKMSMLNFFFTVAP